jgi:toxin ParE1/3/4
MRLVWSRFALEDRDRIFSFISQVNTAAAISLDEMIEQASRRLVGFPDSGRPGRVEGTRELVVSHTPYVMAYAVLPDRIRILRVLHGAQIWPDDISGM